VVPRTIRPFYKGDFFIGGFMIGTVISGILVIYSVAKSLYIATTRKNGRVLKYDITSLSQKDQKEFNNLVSNLLSNITFFLGIALYLIDTSTEYGLYIGILFLIGVAVLDFIFIKRVIPKEYEKLRG
jgi:hypothetical protein